MEIEGSLAGLMSDAGTGSAHHALLDLGRRLAGAGYRHIAVSAASHQVLLKRVEAQARSAATAAPASLRDVFGLSRKFSAEHLPAPICGAMNEAGIVRADGAGWRSSLRVASLPVEGGSGRTSAQMSGPPLLFFHSSYPTVDDDAVLFDPDTYRFVRALRPVLADGPVRRAIDIGCGAGAGAICIARDWPGAEVLAVDLNMKALTLCAVNADLAGAHRLRVQQGDGFAGIDGDFDLIVAHPPYLLDPCERPLRHGGGVRGEQRSCDIVGAAVKRLAPGGRLLLYTGVAMVDGRDPLLGRLAPILENAGLRWRYQELEADIHGDELAEAGYERAERIAAVWLEVLRPY